MISDRIYIPVVAVCPVRAAADHRSEMTSQLLLGEQVHILDEINKEWLFIRSIHDGYEGWCQKIQLASLTDDSVSIKGYFSGTAGVANVNGQPMPVFLGTPVYEATINGGGYSISFEGLSITPSGADIRTILYQHALEYLNTSYLWGGRTTAGIDCSGFAQMVYRHAGIHLLRDAYLQATEGMSVGFLQEAKCGDLAFFEEDDGRITHVGILLNDHEIIHASGKVRIDSIDHAGIINRDTGKRTHQLRIIKRYLD
ncbi:C40 family peptidase [Flavihumibacter sp.]|uniref:C40 family peptidase n=1 Tax=Flavihumibacter sp. TaxID=1913981 RepID=UPI002FC58BFE